MLEGEGEIDDEPVMESYELEFDIKKFLLRCCTCTMYMYKEVSACTHCFLVLSTFVYIHGCGTRMYVAT